MLATQSIAFASPSNRLVSSARPIRSAYLQNEPVACVIPREDALRMSPSARAVLAALEPRIAVELIVPNDEVEIAGIDFIERRADRIVEAGPYQASAVAKRRRAR